MGEEYSDVGVSGDGRGEEYSDTAVSGDGRGEGVQ